MSVSPFPHAEMTPSLMTGGTDGRFFRERGTTVYGAETVDPDDVVWGQQLAELGSNVTAWSGNPCDIVEYSETELHDLVVAEDPLIANLRRDAVTLSGTSMRVLTKRRKESIAIGG